MQRLSTEYLTKIRELLPHGSVKLISQKMGCTQTTASRVLNGKSNFPGVLEEALAIVEDQMKVVKKAENVLGRI